MKGGESLGNEEGSEETSEEDRKEEVSPTRIYTPGVRPLTSGVFLCLFVPPRLAAVTTQTYSAGLADREVLRRREKGPDEVVREKDVFPVRALHAQK